MDKIVTIDGKPVTLRASAALPRRYRATFGRDFFADITAIGKQAESDASPAKKKRRHNNADAEGRTVAFIENLAFLMARSADPEHVPPDITQWLDSFDDPNAIISVAEDVLALYQLNNRATVAPKKKNAP